MVTIVKVFVESIRQAFQELMGNKLRSFLSLLGITIGIFCIIGVKSAVDSLEANVRHSFERLGSDVLYVSKFSWSEPPHNTWWKWIKNPNPSFADYKIINKRVKNADLVSYHSGIGIKTAKYLSSSVDRTYLLAITYEFVEMNNLQFFKGRYLSQAEYQYGAPKAVLGYKVAEELFGNIEPIGKIIKLQGQKMEVVGVLEKSGEDLIGIMNFDEVILISYSFARKFANLNSRWSFDSAVTVKASPGVALVDLKDELTGLLRAHRRLKPQQEEDFAINELTMFTKLLDGFFRVLNLAGLFIGIFAILVGMFSVANIMFVSVKERTNLIGIKKALGAKRYVILLEFLVEAVILCIMGGLFGLVFVYVLVEIISSAINFDIFLSLNNMMMGVLISIFVGILAGVIPAFNAARMDPVEAMRK